MKSMADINSEEIAKLAGVSRTTVSRVINNYPNVRKVTRDKVLKVIEDHNYYPNISGRVLKGKRTFAIGLFLIGNGNISEDFLTNLIISNVIETAVKNNYYVMTHIITDIKNKEQIKRVKEVFYQKRVDAGVFVNGANHEPLIEELIAEGFIIGVVDQDLPGRQETNRIVINYDSESGTKQIMDYLYNMNHRKIGTITGDLKRLSANIKHNQFYQLMANYGLTVNPSWVMLGDYNEESGYQSMISLLKKNVHFPTAIFAASDTIAFGAIRALKEYSLKIPDDISIIGIDDHIISAYQSPPLTTLRIDYKDMFSRLMQRVIAVVEGRSNEFVLMQSQSKLVIRDSCRRI